ncbi:hypothetical protein ACFQZE_06505 [Paenibacillus sp. GCM10027627]|uniref:hypothetical protein n=1 Tax=unclassified Paenibacillus TaxID=185978 RepID=UPI003632F50E
MSYRRSVKDYYQLKKGDHVVMHTCIEHDYPECFGKVWVCSSDEFVRKGHNYGEVFLEGFSGSFSTEYLQYIRPVHIVHDFGIIEHNLSPTARIEML